MPEHVFNNWTDPAEYHEPVRALVARTLQGLRSMNGLVNVREFEQAARAVLEPVLDATSSRTPRVN